MTAAPESIRDKLRKIAALAEHGIDGEAEAARHQLAKLLAKHGLALSDIAEAPVRTFHFETRSASEAKLLGQIVAKVKNTGRFEMTYRRISTVTTEVLVDLTPEQAVDVGEMFRHYVGELRRELRAIAKTKRLLLHAMVQRHRLGPDPDQSPGEAAALTEKERRELVDLMRAMANLRTRGWSKPAGYLEARP